MSGACNLWLMKDDGWSFLFSVGVMGWHDFLGLKEIGTLRDFIEKCSCLLIQGPFECKTQPSRIISWDRLTFELTRTLFPLFYL